MDDNRRDIFDHLMTLPGLRKFNAFYQSHRSVLLYLLFGGLTTFISIGTFILFEIVWGIDVLISNVLSWILAVSFAYITNRIWVFRSAATGVAAVKEIGSFFAGRIATLGIEEVLLLLFVTWLHYNSTVVKVMAQIVVLLLNYIISKVFVFRRGVK